MVHLSNFVVYSQSYRDVACILTLCQICGTETLAVPAVDVK